MDDYCQFYGEEVTTDTSYCLGYKALRHIKANTNQPKQP